MIRTALMMLCVFGMAVAYAQPPSFNFRRLGISEGLHDGTVRCVGQDTFGFIWIGTVGALNRFDGKKIEVFTYDMNDSTTPYSSQPRCMHSDRQGRFWIGYESGLAEYEFPTGTFRKVRTLEGRSFSSIVSINDSNLFLGSSSGLIRMNSRTDDTFFYFRSSLSRHEAGLMVINEVDRAFYQKRIAPVTLQKLLENAIKHNIIDPETPLCIRFYVEGDYLVAENNLQRKNYVETSNKKGLSSLERLYGYISDKPIIIEDNSHFFIVKIPLL